MDNRGTTANPISREGGIMREAMCHICGMSLANRAGVEVSSELLRKSVLICGMESCRDAVVRQEFSIAPPQPGVWDDPRLDTTR